MGSQHATYFLSSPQNKISPQHQREEGESWGKMGCRGGTSTSSASQRPIWGWHSLSTIFLPLYTASWKPIFLEAKYHISFSKTPFIPLHFHLEDLIIQFILQLFPKIKSHNAWCQAANIGVKCRDMGTGYTLTCENINLKQTNDSNTVPSFR